MKKVLLSLAFLTFLISCSKQKKEDETKPIEIASEPENKATDKFYQYSIWWAFVNKVFDGDLKVEKLKKQGDLGLGSFDFLDGELVLLDGVPYRIREDGEVSVGADNDEIVYANASHFKKDGEFSTANNLNYNSFKAVLDSLMPNKNYFYSYKAHGTFKVLKLGGVPKVKPPFNDGLDVLLPKRPIFNGENITGTLVGFYCPEFIGNINVYGYHFHFISDDRKMGGHTLEFESVGPISVEFDEMHNYEFELPKNQVFENVKMEKDFQYNK